MTKKKQKTPCEWRVLEQRVYPNTLNVYLATSRCYHSFATMQLEIHEGLFDGSGRVSDYRTRHTTTQAIYLHDHPELKFVLEVVGRGQRILEGVVLLNLENEANVTLERVGQEGYWVIKEKDKP